jgi:hypothetical protein
MGNDVKPHYAYLHDGSIRWRVVYHILGFHIRSHNVQRFKPVKYVIILIENFTQKSGSAPEIRHKEDFNHVTQASVTCFVVCN